MFENSFIKLLMKENFPFSKFVTRPLLHIHQKENTATV